MAGAAARRGQSSGPCEPGRFNYRSGRMAGHCAPAVTVLRQSVFAVASDFLAQAAESGFDGLQLFFQSGLLFLTDRAFLLFLFDHGRRNPGNKTFVVQLV